jgi:PPM family protein phosphatase
MRYQVIVAQQSDIGLERKENQDAVECVYDERSDCHLLVVADGMGGAACGSLASRLAVETISDKFFDDDGRTLSVDKRLNRALIAANRRIWNEANSPTPARPSCRGMGATCVVLALLNDNACLAHVGDSRIYQIRPDRIVRLTRDHSHVQRLLDGGLITEEEAQRHPGRSSIERALGPREIVRPEIKAAPVPLREGDSFLLCTDGLSSLVHDEEIYGIVLNAPSQQACATLVALAKQRGGHDNITVAIARIGDEVTRAF